MKETLNCALKLVAASTLLALVSSASAQSAGQLTLKAGLNQITPKIESGDLSAPALPGTKADVGPDTEPVFVIGYGVTDNISLELDLGLRYKHPLYGAGAVAGTGQLGTAKVLPPTLFAQYRFFNPDAPIRPYLGAGVTYAYFKDATGSGQLTALLNTGGPATTFEIKNKVAATFQAGVVLALNKRWYLDLAVAKTYLKTTVTFSTNQTQSIKFDPVAVGLGVGYRLDLF